MALQFGKTWWGEQWLRSLANVDYDNRLPRGASYARNGFVKELKINGNQINAKVAGSRPKPYNVTIIVPPFFEDQINTLMDAIIVRPALISKLLNRELDPEILTIAQEKNLKVFPKQWTDFKMQCSCPDWAVPCKHLASVIYMISREIDNNPFLVFEIHNVNLLQELEKRGVTIPDLQKTEIENSGSILKVRQDKLDPYNEEWAYDRIDFSKLRNISEALVMLLPESPPFYGSGDFRNKFSVQFIKIAKEAQKLLSKKSSFDNFFPPSKNKLEINHHTSLFFTIDNQFKTQLASTNHSFVFKEDLYPLLFALNPDRLADFQPSVAAFYKTLLATLHLMANGNIVPQIVQTEDKKFIIRWIPAFLDAEVRSLVTRLSEIIPPDLLLLFKKVGKSEKLLPLENQVQELLSVFITHLVSRLSNNPNEDLFESLFFKNFAYPFSKVGENGLSGGIKVWLDRFYLTKGQFKPIIKVDELDTDQFEVNVSILDTTSDDQIPLSLYQILNTKTLQNQKFSILQTISLLTPFIRNLNQYINSGGKDPILYNLEEFSPFLMEILPAIRLLDIKVLLPKSLQNILKPKVSIKLKRKTETNSFIRLDDLLAFEWQVAIGKNMISPEEFKKLLSNANQLFKYKENFIYVSESEVEKIFRHLSHNKTLSSYELLQAALSEEFEGTPIQLTKEVKELITQLTSNEEIPLPQDLKAEMRPYQHRGFSWMYKNSRIGFGSIIADDMGLGKTIQVISLLLKMKEEKALNKKQKALVVAPTGLLTNWQSEINKFAPNLTSHIFHGAARTLTLFDADIMLTSYGVLRSDVDLMKKQKWQIVVIDEAQNIKNHDTAQAKAIKAIPASVRIAMSGTPVENRLSEFWSIMDFVNKGYLGNNKLFKVNYGDPIQVYNDEAVVNKFKKITAPFMMRRMKTDKSIISDLPDKVEQNQYALLTKQQAALYEKTMHVAMEEIEGISSSDHESLFKRQGLVLQMILALKQICNHPTNFLKNGNFDPSLSGKMELLFELISSIREAGEKVLIFTQFKEMGDLLYRFIQEHTNEDPMFYHGGCTIKERESMVQRFQNNRADKIFILSLKAAGTGLNLTAANHVIHYDLWWNPAVENQATDRAFRIGQKKNVMVHRFITKDTFEEKIDAMIQKKKRLADMSVVTGENWIGKLSNKELREIFG